MVLIFLCLNILKDNINVDPIQKKILNATIDNRIKQQLTPSVNCCFIFSPQAQQRRPAIAPDAII